MERNRQASALCATGTCPHCAVELGEQQSTHGTPCIPSPGGYTVCDACGTILRFQVRRLDLRARRAKNLELDSLAPDARQFLRTVQRDVRLRSQCRHTQDDKMKSAPVMRDTVSSPLPRSTS